MKNLLFSAVIIISLVLAGCQDFLDINQNPNNLNEVSINTILPSGLLYSAVVLGHTTQLAGSFWVQHYNQNASGMQYDFLRTMNFDYSHTFMSAQWLSTYRQTLPALRDLKAHVKDGFMNGEAYVAVSEIMEAFNWHILNSLYDRICYAEGQQGLANLNPRFETSRESYNLIISMYEEILKYDIGELQTFADRTFAGNRSDMIFDGNMTSWMKFANTVYLKMLMRDFASNRSKIEDALDSEIGFLDAISGDAKFARFENLPNKSNPLFEADRRQMGNVQNLRACNSIVIFLNTYDDPRRAALFEPDVNGAFTGGAANARAAMTTSRARLDALDPVYFASAAEAYFLKAEAYARLDDFAAAKENYDAGVKAAFNRWNLDGTSFVAAAGAYEFQNGSEEEMIEQIIIQKWVASVRCQAWDAWFDLNRTGFPKRGAPLSVPNRILILDWSGTVLETGTYPRRFLYPQHTYDFNTNAPEFAPLNEKMWWHE